LRSQKEQSVTKLRETGAGLVASLAAAAGLCIIVGCGGRAGQASDGAVNTGLANVDKVESKPRVEVPAPPVSEAETDLYRLAEESAQSLQALFEQMNRGQAVVERDPPEAAEASPAYPIGPGPALSPQIALAEAVEDAAAAPSAEPPPTAEATPILHPFEAQQEPVVAVRTGPPERPLADRVQETTLVLVDLLRQHSMAMESPMRTFLSLAAMEALWPGALQRIITPESLDGGGLTLDQLTAVETFRDFAIAARALADAQGSETDRLIAAAEKLIDSRPMRIRAASLCARVTGFGQYIPLTSTRFVHGRNHPVIIYVEVAPFAYRQATSAEATRAGGGTASSAGLFAVELSQEIQVYHDVDGLLVWSRPEEVVVEVSRNRRRDFFVVNEIVLPRTFSVGRYRMKIIMRDRTSGAMDEAIIPFEVVADPALAAGLRD
jgi:hypothetical protein